MSPRTVILPSLILLLAAANVLAQQQQRRPNPAFATIIDDPLLPRVLLIGDSISMGYTLPTRELLAGKANVHRIPVNGGPSSRGVESLEKWLGDGRWDLIHFNFGLHDLKSDADGKRQAPLDEYAKNLRTIVTALKKTGAKLIWANTTPVPDGKLNPPRSDDDVKRYNEAARAIMDEHGVQMNDLYAFARPRLAEIQRPANVHFTDDGSRVLAAQVSAAILHAIGRK